MPTVAELAAMKPPLAWKIGGSDKAPIWRITEEGHALLGWIMRANGREARR